MIATDEKKAESSQRLALASLLLSMLLGSLGTSVANVALPEFARVFDASFQQVQWIVLAYLLSITTLIVGVGRLADIAGRRRLLLWGLFLFTAASLLCGIAPTLWMLIAARAVQGLGASVMMALALAFVGETVPKGRTGRAMGLLQSMSAVGTALGPSLGGVLIATLGWRAIFLVCLPLGALAFYLARGHLPADRVASAGEQPAFDYGGTLLLAGTLAAYALSMTVGRGSFGALNLALLVIAAIGLLAFVSLESRIRSPLLRLAMFRNPLLSEGCVMNLIVMTVIITTLIVGPFYLSATLGLQPAMVGLILSVGPVTGAMTGSLAGHLVDRFGSGRMTLTGLGCMALGTGVLSVMPASLGLAGYVPPLILTVAGYTLFQAANSTAVMGDVPAHERGVTAGVLSLSRNLGLITGASVMGAVFAFASGASNVASAGGEAVARGMGVTFAVDTALLLVALVVAVGGVRGLMGAATGRRPDR